MDLVLNCLINATSIELLSLIFFYLWIYGLSKVAHGREAPTIPGAWPILGHFSLLSGTQTPHRPLGALVDKYGPLFTIKLGVKCALVLSNLEMAKECFTKNDMVVSSRPKLVVSEHMAYNGAMFGFASYGPCWRQLRKIATFEILNNCRVEQLHHVRILEAQTSIKELFNVCSNTKNKSGYVLVELKQWFNQLTFNMVLQMAIGKRYFGATNVVEEEEAQRCTKALRELMHLLGGLTVADVIPYLRWFDFGGHVKAMKETTKELDKILGKWLEEHRQNRILGEKVVDWDQDFMDVMLSLLERTTIDGFDDDTIIKVTISTIIAGGIDTSTVTLIWTICLLLRNPNILEKAKEELATQIGKERCISE